MDNLNVYINDQTSQSSKRPWLSPKIIFVVLGLVVLIELIYAAKVLTSPTFSTPAQKLPAQATVGKMSLTSSKTNYQIGETVAVAVVITTGAQTINGADLIVHFDPKILEVAPSGLVQGKIFSEYPLKSSDVKKGLVTISGISSKSGFKGTDTFAVINFKAKAKGEALLTVDFQKGATTDSNLVEATTSKDILEKVDDLKVTVQ